MIGNSHQTAWGNIPGNGVLYKTANFDAINMEHTEHSS